MTPSTQPTNPAGRCFISYRRTRRDEIALLAAALHDHGVPTWQDLTDLDEQPLEPALRAVLDDPGTASAILWITPDIAGSAVITGIEIPQLTARAERGGTFCLIPVAAGGLDYAGAAHAARTPTTLTDFRTWNIIQATHDPITSNDASTIARRALARRITAIHTTTPAGDPLVIDIYTRGPATHEPDAALTVDFTHRFTGRHATPGAWDTHILPALTTITGEATRRASNRPLRFRGLIGLPTATALGTMVLAPTGIPAAWMQYAPGRPRAGYSLAAQRQPSRFGVTLLDQHPGATALAVLVNVSENTIPAVRATPGLPEFRGWVHADPPGAYPHDFTDPGQAADLAHQITAAMRAARSRYGRVGDVHLFIAGPAGLAFLLGQLLNTFGTIHTYEHTSNDAIGHYNHAVTLRPSS